MASGASRADAGPPTWLADRYRLGPIVGRGGMGEVRAATDTRLGREVAVKLLRADLAEIDEVRWRFESEARAAAALVHPNVVAVFDAGEEEGAPYIVMERLPGRTLADELAAGPMTALQVRELATAILGALGAAHDAGIVHRDVKPGNILRTADGAWKVADFGIAKIAEAAGDLTVTGVIVGTPAYVAPERLEGEPATPASDVYSTGVVLYEALTGHRAFTADNSLAVVANVRAGRAPALRQLLPSADPTLIGVVEQAMVTDPGRRFATAGDMQRALARRSPSAGTRPLPRSARPRRRAPSTRRRWLAVAAATALVALGAMGVILWQRDSSPSPTSPAPTTAAPAAAPLPPGLDRALDQLDDAVRR